MTVDIAQQLRGLCQAVLLGGALGMIYDLMRVIRRRVPLSFLGGILDFLFWAAATTALFVFSHEAWDGQIRLYGAVFCFMGGAVYFWGISPSILRISFFLADLITKILGILTLPVRMAVRLFKRFKKFAKTSFLSGKNGV